MMDMKVGYTLRVTAQNTGRNAREMLRTSAGLLSVCSGPKRRPAFIFFEITRDPTSFRNDFSAAQSTIAHLAGSNG
jgi:hypothetical protein